MNHPAIFALAFAVAACGSPQDRLTDQEANVEQGPITGAPTDDDAAPPPSHREPGASADPGPILYRAVGNEPGWSLTVRRERIDYLGNYGEVKISEPTPAGFRPGAGNYATRRLKFSIAAGPCSDGMSDLVYRDTVRVTADDSSFNGCGGGTIAPSSLANTSWAVVAINGRRTGGGNQYFLNFEGNRVSARFGCNSIGGSWSQNGDHVSTSNLEQTLMGCPEPAAAFESEGAAILRSNMRLEASSGTQARLVSEAGSIDLRRAI